VIDLVRAAAYNRRQIVEEHVGEALALLVARYQEEHNLLVDGKLGPATALAVIDRLGAPAAAPDLVEGDHEEPDDADADAPIAIDRDGWMSGADVHRIPSPRSNRLVSRDEDGPAPVAVVWHWSAMGTGTGWPAARRIAKPVGKGQRSASWHVMITRAGEVIQSIPFRRGAWHAGSATAAKFSRIGGRWQIAQPGDVSANYLAASVELENVGELRQVDGLWMGHPFGRGGKRGPLVPAHEVAAADNRHYHAFTPAQEVAARRVLRALVAEYPITMRDAIYGHVDLDPGRKSDPGPLWAAGHLPNVLQAVFG
jgi:hypothetical protein